MILETRYDWGKNGIPLFHKQSMEHISLGRRKLTMSIRLSSSDLAEITVQLLTIYSNHIIERRFTRRLEWHDSSSVHAERFGRCRPLSY